MTNQHDDDTILTPQFDVGDQWERQLEQALAALAEIAPVPQAERLQEYLEPVASEHQAPLLVELIKLDMAARSEQDEVPWIEFYCDAFPGHLPLSKIPLSLVLEEQQLRKELNIDIDQHEYRARFPHLESQLSTLSRQYGADRDYDSGEVDPVLPGQTIDDFEVIAPLGTGAFAQVVLARQMSMARLVALKVSSQGGAESQTLARLDHPNIVRVFDQRQVPMGGPHLLYMQYLPGGTLADVVAAVKKTPVEQRDGRLLLACVDEQLLRASQVVPENSPARAWIEHAKWSMVVAWVGVQLGKALQAAHDQGVLHRDVKPANVLLTAEGVPKLADFNVSFAEANDMSVGSSAFGGSIAYMAPEHLAALIGLTSQGEHSSQELTQRVRERADVYSTAVLLWELWQGQRPFLVPPEADSKHEFLQQQLLSRQVDPLAPTHDEDGTERVLEQCLRRALKFSLDQRTASGAELSGCLRLALHPEAAKLFLPTRNSWTHRIGRWSPAWVAAIVILLPNMAAGFFNFIYNYLEIIKRHPEMEAGFMALANTVNAIAFPVGGILMVLAARPLVTAMRNVRGDESVEPSIIDRSIKLCRHAAWIGGALWGVAAVVYPVALSIQFPAFPRIEAAHFFVSLIICGGVASVYPFFGLALLITLVYYPAMTRTRMHDDHFDRNRVRMQRWSGRYLLAAAGIPLLALTLLLSQETMTRYVVAACVAATAAGLLAAWCVYQSVLKHWEIMASVLSDQRQL